MTNWVRLPNRIAHIIEITNNNAAIILFKIEICLCPAINMAGIHIFKVKKPPIMVADVGWSFQNIGMVLSSWAKPPSLKLRKTEITAEIEKMDAI